MTTTFGAYAVSTSPSPARPVTGSVTVRSPILEEQSSSARSASASGSSWSRVASPSSTAGPVGRERPRRRVGPVAVADLAHRREQHLLDRPLDGAQRERALHRLVGPL